MSDRWTDLYVLFDELADLDTAGREARLREIGERDEALRDRLEAMLAADATADTRLNEYAEAAARSILAGQAQRAESDPLGLIGTTVGHYRIEGLLGAGGMGVVYRATDVRLGRAAALKFLPPALSVDPHAKDRLLHEARAASSLDHPNICAVYEVDETADGTLYVAMACYEGETLMTRLEGGPLDIDEALGLAAQVAHGLAAAHAHKLVHRDIKPANLLVTTTGRLKILDFGIVKAADVGLTVPGQRPGTSAYMAPEQARGDVVDGRADLWSLGVVLYQMLTGVRPAATGQTQQPAAAPSTLRPIVPAEVDDLVLALLEDEPDDRPERAEDVAAELERLAGAATAGDDGSGLPPLAHQRRLRSGPYPATAGKASVTARAGSGQSIAFAGVGILIALVAIGSYVYLRNGLAPSPPSDTDSGDTRFVAVLPFANTSPDSENEYFADGVTDDILTHLAQVPYFSVKSRTTTMGYKGSDRSVPEIARELGVRYVLEGSVRRVGNRVRITAQLVDGRADQYVWAGTYDRQIEDIFAVQTEIAQAIAAALEVELSGGVAARIQRRPTTDLEAYDLFLLGRESLYRYDPEGIRRAVALFQQAVGRDPQFALARAWLGRALAIYMYNQGLGPSWADSAVTVAQQAIADQPDLSDAYTALGTAMWAAGRYREGVAAFERAIELNQNDHIATHNLGALSAMRGSFDVALRLVRRSLELDPATLDAAFASLTYYYGVLGLFERADAALARAIEVGPASHVVLYSQARFEIMRGRPDAAVGPALELARRGAENPGAAHDAAHLLMLAGELERARETAEIAYAHSPVGLRTYPIGVVYGFALLRTGESERGQQVLQETERYAREQIEAGQEAPALPYALAAIHAVRGERDEAFRWLDEAIRFGWNVGLKTAVDPLFENLRGDSRFQSALDRMERELAPTRARVERGEL